MPPSRYLRQSRRLSTQPRPDYNEREIAELPVDNLMSASHDLAVSVSSSSKKHTATRPSSHVPRPPNAFILFRSFLWAKELATRGNTDLTTSTTPVNGERDHREVSRIAGQKWHQLDAASQAEWRVLAQAKKDEHALRFPGWKYAPSGSQKKSTNVKNKKPLINRQIAAAGSNVVELFEESNHPNTTSSPILSSRSSPELNYFSSPSIHNIPVFSASPDTEKLLSSELVNSSETEPVLESLNASALNDIFGVHVGVSQFLVRRLSVEGPGPMMPVSSVESTDGLLVHSSTHPGFEESELTYPPLDFEVKEESLEPSWSRYRVATPIKSPSPSSLFPPQSYRRSPSPFVPLADIPLLSLSSESTELPTVSPSSYNYTIRGNRGTQEIFKPNADHFSSGGQYVDAQCSQVLVPAENVFNASYSDYSIYNYDYFCQNDSL